MKSFLVICVTISLIGTSISQRSRLKMLKSMKRSTFQYEEYWGPSTTHEPYIWQPGDHDQSRPWIADFVSRYDKQRMTRFAEELVQEAFYYFRQTDQMEQELRGMVTFEVGITIGIIREKYNKMMDIFRFYHSRHTNRAYIFPPSTYGKDFGSIYFLAGYEMIHQIEIDIDKRIDVLEHIPEDILALDLQGSINAVKNDQGIKSLIKAAGYDLRRAAPLTAEERLKSNLRQQHLLKAMGLPKNMSTTKKRFIDKWPVEDTWDEVVQKGY